MGIFNQDLNPITRETITTALCELSKKHIEKFEDAGCGMYNLAINLNDDRLDCLVDEHEQVSFFQIYPARDSLNYMWLLTYIKPETQDYKGGLPWDYNLAEFTDQDLILIYQVIRDNLMRT